MVRGRVEVPSRYDRMAKGAGAVRGVARDRRDVINPNPTRLRGRVDGPVPTNRRPAGYLLPGTLVRYRRAGAQSIVIQQPNQIP